MTAGEKKHNCIDSVCSAVGIPFTYFKTRFKNVCLYVVSPPVPLGLGVQGTHAFTALLGRLLLAFARSAMAHLQTFLSSHVSSAFFLIPGTSVQDLGPWGGLGRSCACASKW